MFNKDNFKIAERIKGYGSYDNSVSDEEIQRIKTVKGDVSLKVQPKIIRNLKEFIDYIDDIEPSYTNPVFADTLSRYFRKSFDGIVFCLLSHEEISKKNYYSKGRKLGRNHPVQRT